MILADASIKKIFKIMDNVNGEIRLVGGCVRDHILSRRAHDIDFATTLEPNDVMKVFTSCGIKVVPTGLKHGTITLIINGSGYEITTLRRDINCDGRWANIEFTNDWKEDARRRDFTFNAMYIDSVGNIYDYFGGRQDLKNGRLCFVGNPAIRIAEDYLRILRAFRFYSRFCSQPLDDGIKFAIRCAAENINKLSGERICLETMRILALKNASIGFALMVSCDVFSYVFLSNSSSLVWLNMAEKMGFESNKDYALLKLALLLKENNINRMPLFSRWKMSNKEKSMVSFLLDNVELYSLDVLSDNLRRMIRKMGRDRYINLIKMACVVDIVCSIRNFINAKDIVYHIIARAETEIIPQIPISGNDLLKIGLHGKFIGLCMEKCWDVWEDSAYSLDKDRLLDVAVKYADDLSC
ncbi:Polynucleotide adenylyl transferase [Candidatus Xenohaliotis californiensis]|uniref:Polynucleotide adenylyl transferase n=1 Tax=Candidatus Xenohaliotis californiensis TaxID=84677 RepID=A0ABM9N8C6_9RICK|nr:Polynucleotide adenylyl transferase [Candidatus Xenohaliotis californiensis]